MEVAGGRTRSVVRQELSYFLAGTVLALIVARKLSSLRRFLPGYLIFVVYHWNVARFRA